MNSSSFVLGALLAFGSGAALAGESTVSGDASAQSQTSLPGGTEFNATLTKGLRASKAKPGDEVTAKLVEDVRSDGRLVMPSGTKLIGHVTVAQALEGRGSTSGGTNAQLGVVFDRAVLKDGREIALNASIAALAIARSSQPTTSSAAMSTSGNSTSRSQRNVITGGTGSTVGVITDTETITGAATGEIIGNADAGLKKSAGAVGGLNSNGRFDPGTRGAFGIEDVEIAPPVEGSADGAILTSARVPIKLDTGTRLLLVTAGTAASASANAAAEVKPDSGAMKSDKEGAKATEPPVDPKDRR